MQLHHFFEGPAHHEPQLVSLGHAVVEAQLGQFSRIVEVHFVVLGLQGSELVGYDQSVVLSVAYLVFKAFDLVIQLTRVLIEQA